MKPERKKKVFIINKSGHNYQPAEEFGELIYLSEGNINPFRISRIAEEFKGILSTQAQDGDYIVPTSVGAFNALAGWIMGQLNLSLNLLLFDRKGFYVPRNIVWTITSPITSRGDT